MRFLLLIPALLLLSLDTVKQPLVGFEINASIDRANHEEYVN